MNGASDSPNRDQMADQLQRRQETLEISGWGLPFRFFQPHNPCFWAFVALTIWGVIQMWEQWSHVNLGIATSPEGDTILVNSASGEQVSLTGGRLAGLFQSINEIVPEFENQLNEFSNGLIHQFNQTHATGVGASGPFEPGGEDQGRGWRRSPGAPRRCARG